MVVTMRAVLLAFSGWRPQRWLNILYSAQATLPPKQFSAPNVSSAESESSWAIADITAKDNQYPTLTSNTIEQFDPTWNIISV